MRYHVLLFAIFLLPACSGGTVKDTLGLNRSSPDEFRVVTRPPLSVPPQFDLRPPAEPGESVSARESERQARSLITGAQTEPGNTFRLGAERALSSPPSAEKTAKTTPESNFLERAGAKDVNPDIRRLIEADKRAAAQTVEEEDSWWDIFTTLPAKKDPLVDAEGEAERIKQAKESGAPVNEGETPELNQRDTGVLGRILGY